MVGEPELKTATRQRSINPLTAAWGVVVSLLVITIAWVVFSEDPVVVSVDTLPADEALAETDIPASSVALGDLEPQVEVSQPGGSSALVIDSNSSDAGPQTSSSMPEPQNNDQDNSLSATQTPLPPAPNQNLLVRGDNGFKPALGPDGMIAWQEYARPFTGDNETPRIAIMVTDIGLNTRSSNAAIDNLPGQVDLAFSPYGRNLQDWMDKARARGHEGFLMVPTEPVNYPANDPGPHTLITDFNPRDNLLRLDWVLSQVAGYVGVINHMGSKFTASEEALTPILTDLHGRGLMFVDARSSRFSMAARVARNLNMPRAINDRYIDNVITADEIQSQLRELEITANTFGVALGLARATPLTINQIAQWSESLDEKGIDLVPVTAIANRQPIR